MLQLQVLLHFGNSFAIRKVLFLQIARALKEVPEILQAPIKNPRL